MQRVTICMRIAEGQGGTVTVQIVPKHASQPTQRIACSIPSLCFHQRVHQLDSNKAYSQVDVTGDFSAADAHQWLSQCLLDLPQPQPQSTATVMYEHPGLHTQMAAAYRDGSVQLASDNIWALALLRSSVVRYAARSEQACHFLTGMLAHIAKCL